MPKSGAETTQGMLDARVRVPDGMNLQSTGRCLRVTRVL